MLVDSSYRIDTVKDIKKLIEKLPDNAKIEIFLQKNMSSQFLGNDIRAKIGRDMFGDESLWIGSHWEAEND